MNPFNHPQSSPRVTKQWLLPSLLLPWLALALSFLPLALFAQVGQTVTWAGGNSYKSWLGATNWSPQVVPLNNAGTNFTVIVPDTTSLAYDSGSAGTIEALSFGNSTLRVRGGSSLVVTSATVIKGIIDAQGPGSYFRATANQSVLQNYPRLWAADGARIGVMASSYAWANAAGNYSLLSAVGDGSRLELTNVTALTVNYGNSGQWVYSVNVKSNGVIDLSRLGQITGPGSDDWLDFNLESGGSLLLRTNLAVAGRVRFNVGIPDYEIPYLGQASETYFNVTTGATLCLPSMISFDNGGFTLATNASIIATNLVSFRYSDLPILPGRTYQLGGLNDIYASRLSVAARTTLRVAATSYGTPANWSWYGTLFSAEDTGSLLDLSSITSMDIHYQNNSSYDYRFKVTANNGGVIDLSGLQTLAGPEYSNRYLEFNIRNGGDIRLSGLKQLTRYQSFNIEVPQYTLPALETADTSTFSVSTGNRLNLPQAQRLTNCRLNLADGARADMPLATSLAGSSFSWGFNSTINAPNVTDFSYGALALAPGLIFNGTPFNNIYASQLSVSGGTSLRVAATSYGTPANWSWYGTLFSAEDTGSLLDLSSITSMDIHYQNNSGYDYRLKVTANNGGVIDLSGLQTLAGPEYSNRYLEFSVSNGGDIRLPALKQLSRYVQFNVQVPQYVLPALESAANATFNLADGRRLDLPQVRTMSACSFGWGFNSRVEAPLLQDFQYGNLAMAPGRIWVAPQFTNIYASQFFVSAGTTFRVAATSYGTPAGWGGYGTLFSADGTGSLLDLSSVNSMDIHYQNNSGYDYRFMVAANNGGVIDLSGLQTLAGPEYNNRYLEFNVSNSGKMRFGNLGVSRYENFNVSGLDSQMEFASLYLRSPANLSVGTRGLLNIYGDLLYDNTDPNSIVVEGAYFLMNGAQPQRLEVGGRDSGPGGFTTHNFGYSQLIVGSSNQTSVVRLVDTLNNGQRGAGGEPEALYLYGMDGAGLRILNGSRFVLNGLNAYAFVNGQMRSLRSLIPPGTNSVAFDGGFLANFGGPSITNMTPSVAVTPPVSWVDVAFDQPIQPSSFTPSDVNITGPGGSIPATGVAPVGGTTWRVSFAPQSADGTYTVKVGPAINELAANLLGMDQNGDGLSGDGTNDTFVATFIIDSTAPVVTAAYGLQKGNRVGITFNEIVVPATATNAANYTVNGLTPSNVVLQADGRSVALSAPAMVGDTFTLGVNSLGDLLGNTTNRTFIGTILPLSPKDLGTPGSDPREPGSTVAYSDSIFDMVAGGSGIWYDYGHFLSELRTGDFDTAVRIQSQTRVGSWTQSGIMARESLDATSREVYAGIQYGTGYDRFTVIHRASTGGGSDYWPNSTVNTVPIPNAWLRLKREGSVFIASRGTNGTDWVELARVTNSLPATVYVGLASSANNNNVGGTTSVQYRDFREITPAIITHPQSQSVISGANVTFGVTARGLPVLAYQWQLNGVALPGETNSLLQLLAVTTNRVGGYRVVVSNSYGSTTSQEATLMVDGTGCGSFEADVAPRPNGNNAITVSDWVQVGRAIAGLDPVMNSSEFQRVDCAPRTNALLGTLPLGDGRLSVVDWTQAGRYAAGVDPLTPAGGPTAPAALVSGGNGAVLTSGPRAKDSSIRSLSLVGGKTALGQSFTVPVELLALGGENALGFSVLYDPARLVYQGATLGEGAAGAALQVNASQAPSGSVGLVLAKSVAQSFPAGTATVVRVQFRAVGTTGTNSVAFGDAPVWREVADVNADVQPAAYVAGAVRVVLPGQLSPDVRFEGGTVALRLTGEPGERYRVEVSTDLAQWTPVSTVAAGADPVVVRDSAAGGVQQRFYRAVLVVP